MISATTSYKHGIYDIMLYHPTSLPSKVVIYTRTNNIKLYIENKTNATLPPLFSFLHDYLPFNIGKKQTYTSCLQKWSVLK